MLVVPDVGEAFLLDLLVNSANRVLKLFTNNLTPSDSTTLSGITEASGSGYSSITLTGGNWTVATVSGVTTASFAEQTFSFTGAATVYGYYVTTAGGSPVLLWVERFTGAPFTLPSGGGQIGCSLRLNLD